MIEHSRLLRLWRMLCISLLFLPACAGSAAIEPTATQPLSSTPLPPPASPTSTHTALPTSTPLPTDTSTPVPSLTPTPAPLKPTATETASGFPRPLPAGIPLGEWQGIPIHPEALAGEEDQGSYVYTAALSPEQIESYYRQEMPRRGWALLTSGQSPNGGILMIFQKGAQMTTISVLVVDEAAVYVMIV